MVADRRFICRTPETDQSLEGTPLDLARIPIERIQPDMVVRDDRGRWATVWGVQYSTHIPAHSNSNCAFAQNVELLAAGGRVLRWGLAGEELVLTLMHDGGRKGS